MAATTVFISFTSLLLFAFYTFHNRSYLNRNKVVKKDSISPRVSGELRDRKNCPIHMVAEMGQNLIKIFLFDEIHFYSTKYNFIR